MPRISRAAIGGIIGSGFGFFSNPGVNKRYGETSSQFKRRRFGRRVARATSMGLTGAVAGSFLRRKAGKANLGGSGPKANPGGSGPKANPGGSGGPYTGGGSNPGGGAYTGAGPRVRPRPKVHPETQSFNDALRGAKTRAEAKSIHRRSALKNHPDKGGSNEAMSGINNSWSNFQNSSAFSKMAQLMAMMRSKGKL